MRINISVHWYFSEWIYSWTNIYAALYFFRHWIRLTIIKKSNTSERGVPASDGDSEWSGWLQSETWNRPSRAFQDCQSHEKPTITSNNNSRSDQIEHTWLTSTTMQISRTGRLVLSMMLTDPGSGFLAFENWWNSPLVPFFCTLLCWIPSVTEPLRTLTR